MEAVRAAAEPPLALAGNLRWNMRTSGQLPKADLYYLHSYNQFLAVSPKARRRDVPYIYDAHDFYSEEDSSPEAAGIGRLSGRLLGAIERACVRRAAGLSTVSEGVADLMEARFGRRPEVIRNCPDLRLDRASATTSGPGSAPRRGRSCMVSVGNAKVGDTIEEALLALEQLPDDVHLAFVGGGYERHRERVREHRLEGRVHFLAPAPPTEVAAFISTADASPILYRAFTPNFHNALPEPLLPRDRCRVAADLSAPGRDQRALSALRLGRPDRPGESGLDRLRRVRAVRGGAGAPCRIAEAVAAAARELCWEAEEGRVRELVETALDGGAESYSGTT